MKIKTAQIRNRTGWVSSMGRSEQTPHNIRVEPQAESVVWQTDGGRRDPLWRRGARRLGDPGSVLKSPRLEKAAVAPYGTSVSKVAWSQDRRNSSCIHVCVRKTIRLFRVIEESNNWYYNTWCFGYYSVCDKSTFEPSVNVIITLYCSSRKFTITARRLDYITLFETDR